MNDVSHNMTGTLESKKREADKLIHGLSKAMFINTYFSMSCTAGIVYVKRMDRAQKSSGTPIPYDWRLNPAQMS